MPRRSVLSALVAGCALLTACGAEETPAAEQAVAPTAPAALRASLSATPTLTEVDTTSASSVCRTVVRQRAAASKQLEAEQSNAELTTQVGSLDAIVADVCQ
jgi:hypothetical protein